MCMSPPYNPYNQNGKSCIGFCVDGTYCYLMSQGGNRNEPIWMRLSVSQNVRIS